jgi:flagellar P-ring protein FlgI
MFRVGLFQRWISLILLMLAAAAPAYAGRIKDIATVQGVRSNPLLGYGLVVGLDGSGDQTNQTPFTTQSLTSMLTQMGVTVPAGTNLQVTNVAAVMVTGNLPAFSQPGQAIDVTVSAVGNAKSLRGGTLLLTPLKGADGHIYALAQGNVVVGGAGAAANGSKTQVNHLSVGRVPNGGLVERALPPASGIQETIQLELIQSDFTTARRVVEAINGRFGEGTASAVDARVLRIKAPAESNARIAFLADIENLDVKPGDLAAKVIFNARTGSVVLNKSVTLEPAAVAHGNLTVTIRTEPVVSQPAPLSPGRTVQGARSDISVQQGGGGLGYLPNAANLADVVKALNALGATPQDLLAILQALKAAGALRAELEVL